MESVAGSDESVVRLYENDCRGLSNDDRGNDADGCPIAGSVRSATKTCGRAS